MATLNASHAAGPEADEYSERRYVALASLARRLSCVRDWDELVDVIGQSLGECEPALVRLWGMTADGLREVACSEEAAELATPSSLELSRAATASEPGEVGETGALVGLHADGVTFGVLEVHGRVGREVLGAAAAMIVNRLFVLAGQGVGELQLSPEAIDDASDASSVISDFAHQAKRLLDHDRLSVYLLTYDGRAFERFAVATSAIVPGEGVLIPFEDVGLRHIVLTNRPLLSSDLGADPRLLGAEDRVVASAGFRGLLSVPLRHNGRPFGVLNFVSRKSGFYRKDDIPIGQQIADQIAAFVQNLRHQRRAQTFVRQEASERERTRLVRDLYQAAAGAVAEIGSTATEIADGDARDARASARRIRDVAEDGLADMRRAIVDLDPPGLESGGLAEMAQQAVDRLQEQALCEVTLRVDGDPSRIGAEVARTTYRVLQEALMNAKRHSEARSVGVTLSVERDLELNIDDDGNGFNTRAAQQGEGLGLRQMRERTEALGGFLTITSKPGTGTSIRLKIPEVGGVRRSIAAADPTADEALEAEGTLRVFVAETNVLLRAGLCRLVERDERLRVVGETGSSEELLGHLRQLHPDVVVLNASLAEGDAKEFVADIREASSSAILVVSHDDVGRDADLIESGATGVVRVTIEQEGLIQAIHAVACGTRVIGGSEHEEGEAKQTLTPRERSVLALVAEGQTNAQIGISLYLATKTVERQVTTIVRKLSARNRAHAAAIAVARRIIKMPGEFN